MGGMGIFWNHTFGTAIPLNLSTVSVLANRSLHQDLMHSGCHGRTVPNVCLQRLSPFPFSLLAIFHPFPEQRACSQSTSRVAKGDVDRIEED